MLIALKKVLSLCLSLVMIILSAFGVGTSVVTDGMTVGPWLQALCVEFGMTTYESETPYYANVTAEDPFFGAVQACYEWGIIDKDDTINTAAPLTNAFAAKCLVKAARLEADTIVEIKNAKLLDYAEDIAIAIANGLFELASNGSFKVKVLKEEEALKVLAEAKTIWANQAFDDEHADYIVKDGVKDLTAVAYDEADGKLVYDAETDIDAGDIIVTDAGAYEVKNVKAAGDKNIVSVADVALEDAVDSVNLEGTIEADLDAARVVDEYNGEVVQDFADEAFAAQGSVGDWVKKETEKLINKGIDAVKKAIYKKLANPKISFSVKGFKVKASYSSGTVALSVSGKVEDHVAIEKAYELSNINFSTKYDADLANRKIHEAYVIANYDLVDYSSVTGSYAASVVPKEVEEDEDDPIDFLDRVKNNLFKVREGSGVKIDVVSFEVPVGSTGLTVSLKLSVTISVSGKIEITILSNQTKGIEVIDNHVRYISDHTVYDREYGINGDFKLMLGLYLTLTFLTYDIIDAYIAAGLGAYVATTVYRSNGTVLAEDLEISEDVYMEATAGNEKFDETTCCFDIDFYGILSIGVGENSLCKKIGLHKTWNILNKSNATIAHWHIENGKRVDKCTKAA